MVKHVILDVLNLRVGVNGVEAKGRKESLVKFRRTVAGNFGAMFFVGWNLRELEMPLAGVGVGFVDMEGGIKVVGSWGGDERDFNVRSTGREKNTDDQEQKKAMASKRV